MKSSCPVCGHTAPMQAIYYGLPVRLCVACSALWACWAWDWLIPLLPFGGGLMIYHGSYWPALWAWLRRPDDE